jgi:hypothetical protein
VRGRERVGFVRINNLVGGAKKNNVFSGGGGDTTAHLYLIIAESACCLSPRAGVANSDRVSANSGFCFQLQRERVAERREAHDQFSGRQSRAQIRIDRSILVI